jgi:hypothetical protein
MNLLREYIRGLLVEKEDNELYGNCGMVAIAMVKEAERLRIKNVRIILVHDAASYGFAVEEGEYDIAHVVAEIDNRYFDDRGEITKEQISVIDGEDLLDPHVAEVFVVDYFKLTPAIEQAIERNTSWDKCPREFENRAKEILNKAGYLP